MMIRHLSTRETRESRDAAIVVDVFPLFDMYYFIVLNDLLLLLFFIARENDIFF